MSWTCPNCNSENPDFIIEGIRKTKCLCGYDSLSGKTDTEQSKTSINQTANELYEQAFHLYEQEKKDDLIDLCSTLFNAYPDTKEVKWALKNFPITWDRDKKIVSYNPKNLPLRWFKFYTYFRMPIGLIITILSAMVYLQMMTSVAEKVIILSITASLGVLIVLVFVGLHKRRIWGWYLNWILIVVEIILNAFGRAEDVMSFAIFLTIATLLWFLPNYIYFKKRRCLFT